MKIEQIGNQYNVQNKLLFELIYNNFELMQYRTKKCNHGEKARCINCLTQQIRAEKQNEEEKGMIEQKSKCFHPPNMKCLKCLPSSSIKKQEGEKCHHSDFEKCPKCWKNEHYENFDYYVQKMENDCQHKKPCRKCVPIQARKTFSVDRECRNHLPYPQAQCDACMAPTLSVMKQPYSHVSKVVIRTTSVHRIIDSNLFGILLGSQKQGVVYVEDVYFPEQQVANTGYISPEIISRYQQIFQLLGYNQVGLIYSSSHITALSLLVSSVWQQHFISINSYGYQISKFITMRLHYDEQDPYFECFMISDQFQTLHKNNLIFQKEETKNYFDLISAKNDKDSAWPTFLRKGVETDRIQFKQIIVWIETISEENFFAENPNLAYPFFKLDQQTIEDMEMFMLVEIFDPIDKYRNIQFILHMDKLFGRQDTLLFLTNFIFDDPDFFLSQKIKESKQKSQHEEPMRSHPKMVKNQRSMR